MNTTTKHGDKVRENILYFIGVYFDEHGYMPSLREIGENTGLRSTSSVNSHMTRLFADGRLETDAPIGTPRAYRLGRSKNVDDTK